MVLYVSHRRTPNVTGRGCPKSKRYYYEVNTLVTIFLVNSDIELSTLVSSYRLSYTGSVADKMVKAMVA